MRLVWLQLRENGKLAKKRAQVNKELKAADAQPPEMPGESSTTRGEGQFDLSSD